MKRAAIKISILAGVLLLVCIACRVAMHNTYVAVLPAGQQDAMPGSLRINPISQDLVTQGAPEVRNERLQIPIQPQRPGEAYMSLEDGRGNSVGLRRFHVSRLGTVYDYTTGGFSGDFIALIANTAFYLAAAAIMFRAYREAKGPAFYAYGTIYAAGFSLFTLLTGLMMLEVTLRHFLHPYEYNMLTAYRAITSASWRFMMATAPMLLVFAGAMAVSNIELLRHERFRPQNVLGIGIALALAAGEALAYVLYSRGFSGMTRAGRARETLCNVYATGFAYFECMLFGAVVCGLKAARHVPVANADYILILGCRFRKDGTLTPLLQGRVDRAIAFWKRQRELTGKTAALMPTGGQGPDETMAEAEAMRRYLLAQGIPEGSITIEDQSRNTYQNMEYSKKIIDGREPGARVVFATTNYHVFRSGVWAGLAGLPAEGMGSRTKWWYWPNAFMRECVGLMRNRIPQELALLVIMVVFFGMMSMALR